MHVLIPLLLACSETNLQPETTPPTDPTASPTVEEPAPFGPSLVVNDLHIAGFAEDFHAFSLLGSLIDPLLAQQLEDGTLLLGIELRDVADPLVPDDEDMSVGMYPLEDSDDDLTDNFVPGTPETFLVPSASVVDDEPAIHFVDASMSGGELQAAGAGDFDLLGEGFPLPFGDVELSGSLAFTDKGLTALSDGRLTTALGASLLTFVPNPLGEGCVGAQSLLDVLATGCGLIGIQPDADLDDDGLEQFFDDDEDGVVDRCVDGNGTEILGTDCPTNAAIADGYQLIFVITGIGAELLPE